MQQQASAWLDAARGWINKKRPSIHRIIIATLVAPLIVSVAAPVPASAATLAAVDSYCTQTISSTTGVTVTHSGNTCIVTFGAPSNTTTTYTWTAPVGITSYQILVVGGGGGGGGDGGHGGGGGELRYDTTFANAPSANTSVTIQVGKGGAAYGAGDDSKVTWGGVDKYIAKAGAGGAGWNSNASAAGGTGGTGGTGTNGQTSGYAMAANTCVGAISATQDSSSGNWYSGLWFLNGGGAAVEGLSTTAPTNSITGSSKYYGGAGGGGWGTNINYPNIGPIYGLPGGGTVGQISTSGGRGANWMREAGNSTTYRAGASDGEQGVDGTGGGGGGGNACDPTVNGAAVTNGVYKRTSGGRGGSGAVIVRYDLPIVTFNSNGATGYTGAATLNVTANGTVTLPGVSSMVRSGFTFAGWNTAANGTGTNYAGGASYTPSANITLYAQWNSTISYNTNGATTTQSVLSTTATGSGATTTLSNGLGTGTPISSGLVLSLDASDPTSISGTTWTNKSSSGLASATIVGSPKYDQTDGSFQLNGVDQYFSLGSTDYAYVGTTAFSINLSFNPTDPNTTSCLFARYNGNVAGSYQMKLVANSALGVYREVSPWGTQSSALIQTGNTYYASMTYDGTNLRGYLNGNLVVGPTALGSVYASTIATQIGGCQYNTAIAAPFKGKIYNAQIYSRALSASEVLTNYQNLLGGRKIGKTNYTLGPWTTAADTGTAYGNPVQFDISALPTPYFRLNADSYVNNSTPFVPSAGASNLSITTTGTLVAKTNGGKANGANAQFATIGGTTSAGIRLGNSEVKNYTLCTLARYAPKSDGTAGAKGRLIANQSTVGNSNWFSGWYMGNTRQYHHGAWVLMPTDVDDDWHLSCDSGNTIYWDGVLQSSGVTPQAYTGLPQLAINWDYNAQNSDWEFAEMIVYDQVLAPTQMDQITRYFTNRYGLINVNTSSGSAAAPSTVTNYSSTGNTTLYASWQSTITYDANDATYGTAPASQAIWNTPGTVSANTGSLSKNGFIFNGWNTAANGSGTRYAVGAPLINDGNKVLYAQWVLPVNFPIAKINPSSLAPYQRFVASDYDATNKIWKDSSGNGRNAGRVAGTPSVTTTTANSNGAGNSFKVFSGGTGDKIWFGNAPLTPNWTVFALTRYSGATKARILSGDPDRSNSNILIGQWQGAAGVTHINGWIGGSSTPAGITVTNWIMSTVFPYNYRLNGSSMATSGGNNVLGPMGINTYSTEVSNFEVAEVIIFDRTLSSSEITQVEDYFDETYGLAYPKVGSYKSTNSLTVANSIGGRSDTFTATDGFGTKTFSISPTIPGITIDVSTTNSVALVAAPTLAVGTYNETITATDAAGNSTSFPIQITVVNPLIWSGTNPSAVVTTYGKSTRTTLNLSGGFGTRVALLSHSSSPAPRGITIDTSTIASGYITFITDTGTAPGTYIESITVTDSSRIVRTLLMTVTVNAPPDITYSASTDASYPYVTSGLVASVDAGNPTSYSGAGSNWNGLDGTNYNFTLNGSPTYGELAGGSLYFTGTQSASSTTNLTTALDVFTVESWFNLKTLSSVDPCFVTSTYVTGNINFAICQKSGNPGTIRAGYYASSGWRAEVTSSANSISANTWYHVAYTLSKSGTTYTGTLFLNGIPIGTSTSTVAPTLDAGPIRIGKNWYSANYADGNIPVVRLYNTALSAAQIRQNYANTKTRFVSLSASSPTISGNAVVTTTEGKATTYQVFAETGGTGTNTFSLSGANSTFSLASVGTDQTSLIVGSATTATNSTTAKTYYETLTATDSTTAATAYYVTVNVNPKIAITAATDTVTTTYYTYGKIAYDTITAAYGTGTLTYSRVSSSNSSAITTSVTGNQLLLGVTWNLPVGTYYETFTVTDSVGATSVKVITIIVNPQMSVVSATGSTTLTTTYSIPSSLRVNISGGTGTKVISMYKTSLTPWKLTVDTSTLASNYVTFRVDSYTAVGSHSINIGFTDVYGAYAVIGVTVNVNPYPQINGIANDKSYVTTGLVVNLDAGDPNSYPGTGTTWKDLSGPAGNFTFQGTPTYSAADGGSIRTSSGNWVQSNDTYTLLTNMTIEATFKVNAFSTNTSSNRCVVTTYDGGTAPNFGLCFVGTSAKIRGAYWSASAWRGVSTATTDLVLNTWYHAVYSVSCFPGQFCLGTLYLNGVSQGTSTSEANFPVKNDPNRIIVGKRYNDGVANDQFDGWIQTIRIYGNTIGTDAITQNYNAFLARTKQSNAITVVTTQGGTVSSPDLVVTGGTGSATFTTTPSNSNIALLPGNAANSAMFTSQTTLAAQDSQTAKSYVETLTATDELGASVKFKVTYLVNPPIIETATATTLTTTSGIETSTVIYATKGTGDKTFTLTGDASSGVSLVSGTNQATLRVLSTINPGTYWETITASDTSAATTSIAVKVIVNSVPTIVGRTTITSTTSTAYKSLGYYVANGTGTLKLTMSPTISGITLDTSTAGVAYIRLANTLTTESTNYETLTVTDANGAVGRLIVMIKIVAPVSLTGNKTVVSTFGDSNLFSYTATGGTSPYNIAITGQQSTCITSKSIDGSNTVEQFLGGMKPGTSCTWVVPNGVTSLTGLVIAGGGQGGTGRAGGGGAGTMIEGSMTVAAGDVLTVTVGAGGSNASCASANSPAGCDGIDSIIGIAGNTTYIVAKGGGGGGGHLNNYSGRTGGSGGGAGMNYASVAPVGGAKSGSNIAPAGWTAYSNDGAATADTEVTPNNYRNTGGGGGAGSTGFPGSCTGASPACNNSGTGGGARPDGGNARANSITGTSTMYAGGGGGSVAIATSEVNGSYKSAIAGNDYSNYLTDKGGAGKGASPTRSVGTDAAANTGSGGGGSITDSGGYGASGIVVFRYLTPTAAPANSRISFSLINASTGQFNMTVPESITVGTYLETVTVSSSNDASNIQTTAVISVVVIQDTPTATVSLPGSVLTAKYGTPVTLTAATSTNGRVNFKKAGASISGCGNVATSNGLATCTWIPTAVESTLISALLTPSDSVNYRTSIETDTAITVVVGKADTLTITANTPTAITYSASMTMPTNGFTTSGLQSIDSITALSYSYMTGLGSTCATGGICSVGDRGPAGGVVFYVSSTVINVASGISTGGIYLEAAPSSTSTTYNWCNNTNSSVGSNGINIGQGADDTRMNAVACTSGASYQAANLTQAGYSDWFLPSNYELIEMSKIYSQIGMDETAFYWSASEYIAQLGYVVNPVNGVAGGSYKYSNRLIWPIRAFGGENLISGAPTNAGTYSIVPNSATFNPGAESNYVSVQYKAGTLVINKAPRGTWSTTYNAGTNSTRYGVGKTETATVTFPGDGIKTFSSASSVCSVDSSTGTLTTLGVGACDVQTVLPATRNWLSDTKTVTVTIDRGLRTATVTPVLTTIKYGDTITVTSTVSPALDSATVTYSNNSTLGCAVDNVTGEITGIKALTSCTVRVTFDQTSLYESATATASITVNKATAPVVTTDSITAIAYTGATALVTPTYSVTGILARDISQILPLADVSTTAAISAIAANTYSTVASYRYRETSPTTAYDSTTAPSLGGTYSVTPQTLTLLGGLDIDNYETPTYVSRNLVITPIAQAPLIIKLSYLESVTVPFDVVTTGGSSTGARTLSIQAGGTATGCSVDTGVSSMRLKSSTSGTCVIQVTQAADRNYLAITSDSQTVNILNFVVNILQLFDNPTGISINHDVPVTKGPDACVVNCQPRISQITDVNGTTMTTMQVGTSFRIIGTNFNTTSAVLFSGVIGGEDIDANADSFQVDSDTQITVMPPSTFVPNAGESVSNIRVVIFVRASGGLSPANMTIVAISL